MIEFETTEEAVEALVLVNNLRVEGVQGEAEGMEFDIKLCFSRTFNWPIEEGEKVQKRSVMTTAPFTEFPCIADKFFAIQSTTLQKFFATQLEKQRHKAHLAFQEHLLHLALHEFKHIRNIV